MIVDAIVLVAFAAAAAAGYRAGFVQRILTWSGLVLGLVLAMWTLPLIVRAASGTSAGTRLLLVLRVLVAAAAVGTAIGEVLGFRLHRVLPPGVPRLVDRLGGAVASGLAVLVLLWLLAPVAADVPGEVARATRDSAIVRGLERVAPSAPDVSQTLRALVAGEGFPDVFDELRPAPDIAAPPASVDIPAATLQHAIDSTVKVESEGCGAVHQGSGFTVAAGTVVTNAHVVAGGSRITVVDPSGRHLSATIVVFDDNRDLAVLAVGGLEEAPLAVVAASVGTEGAVLGHPGGQDPVRVAPAAIRQEILAVGRDIYGEHITTREVLVLAASLAPGDSGAAMIDGGGRVVGVAFAIAPDRPDTAYGLTDTEIDAVLAAPRVPGVGGSCM